MKNVYFLFAMIYFGSASLQITAQKNVSFTETWSLRTNPERGQTIIIDQADPSFFYFANKEGGLKIYHSEQSEDPIEIKHFPVDSFGQMHVMNIFQHEEYLYVALGDFFSKTIKPTGLAIIDISSPEQSFITSIWQSNVSFRGSPYISTNGEQAWLCAMEYGVIFLDVTDKYTIDSITTFLPNTEWPVQSPTSVQFPNIRYTEVVDNIMYVCFDAGGLRILDISNTDSIFEINRYINPLFNSTQQAYNTMHIEYPLAFIALDYCGFEIIDISNTDSIIQIAQTNPWNCEDGVWLFNEGHTNQICYDSINQLIYFSSGDSEVMSYDVSNPAQPVFAGQVGGNGNIQGAWGVTVAHEKAYVSYIETIAPFFSNYSGIKIFDITIDSTKTSLSNPYHQKSLQVYPNPFKNGITIEIEEKFLGGKLFVFDFLGRELLNIDAEATEIFISEEEFGTGNHGSGVYYLRLVKGKNHISLPIIKMDAP